MAALFSFVDRSLRFSCGFESIPVYCRNPLFAKRLYYRGPDNQTGLHGVFFLRTIFWLGLVVLMLPPSSDGKTPAPRVSLLETVSASRALISDLGSICSRNEAACAISRETIDLVAGKIRTGAGIAAAMVAGGSQGADHGSLTGKDLEPLWSARGDG